MAENQVRRGILRVDFMSGGLNIRFEGNLGLDSWILALELGKRELLERAQKSTLPTITSFEPRRIP